VIRTLVLAALVATTPLAAQQATHYTLAGETVAIYNLVGTATVEGGGSGDVGIDVTASGEDAAKLAILTTPIRGNNALRVDYPSDRIVYPALGRHSNTSFTVREDGTWGGSWDGERSGRGRRQIRVTGDGDGLRASADLRITVPRGRSVKVYVGVGRVEVHNVDGRLVVDVASADISSRGTRGTLSLDTGSGAVRVDGHEGDLDIDTGSGEVAVSHHRGGSLDIDTGSGDVTGNDLGTSTLKIDTGSGEIHLDLVTATRVSLETGSGAITAQLAGTLESLSAETGSGDVTLRLPESISATVDLETSSGDLTLEFPVTLIRKGEGHLRGKIGDGTGRIEVETGSGDVKLLR